MFVTAWTVDHGQNNLKDYFLVFDTIDEARSEAVRLSGEDDVYCWAVMNVLDSSEPHWIEDQGPSTERPIVIGSDRDMDEILDEAFAAVFRSTRHETSGQEDTAGTEGHE